MVVHHRIKCPASTTNTNTSESVRVPSRCIYIRVDSTTTHSQKKRKIESPEPKDLSLAQQQQKQQQQSTNTTHPSTQPTFCSAFKTVKNNKSLYKSLTQQPASDSDCFDELSLLHFNGQSERFPLAIPKAADEFNPIQQLKAAVQHTIEFCVPLEKRSLFGDDIGGTKRKVVRAVNRKDPEAIKEAVLEYNQLLGSLDLNLHSVSSPAHPALIAHVLDEAYAHTVAPDVDSLKNYKTFSNNVYGEVRHSLVSEFIERVKDRIIAQPGSPPPIFLDMGSGTGNVVLQVAAETQCEAHGIEIMENPARLATLQRQEFLARCNLYKIPVGSISLVKGDFLDDPSTTFLLPRADVIFVNNYAFDAHLNFRILERFLDLKEGAVVISLKPFGSTIITEEDVARGVVRRGGENALEGMFVTREYWFGENRVSWMAEGGKYYVHTLRR
ncbi:DOT1-domain-containing protein [Rhizoclosmatium globosum]|uniref:Histone-lysine N-methyltransferase, H3 lysine-79 specific n=1 Tax=Rhizoclosmatium globosum TaxID=329046 RepID=A0A1Y2C1P0_9FUNG|nr:DOT1-domain-containing protein [Rhizoclosmatium globosum]|eukprot:ORY40797.1 DOT1-domain-containing protein [Rhizoclosmatium globosum]